MHCSAVSRDMLFSPVRPRIDMTVPAGLIAELADIDLKDRDPGGTKRKQADVIELRLEGGAARGLPEHLQLLRGGGEGVMLSQQGQRHICACQKGRKLLRGRSPSAHMTDRHQRRFWKPQLTAAEIQGLSLPVCQGSLDRGRDSVTHLFAVPMSLDQTRVSQNTEMMGGMGLRALQFLTRSVTHFSPMSKDSKIRSRVSSPMALSTVAHWRGVSILVLKGPSSAAAFLGGAGDGVTADVLARAIDDREMRSVAVGSQYCQRLGTDLHRFASAIHMVIVIGGFDEGSGEHGEMPLPVAGSVCRIDRGPSVIGSIQP